jgi:hypothetical protein
MRNIFDQYSSSNLENRVTHAFAHALASHRGVRRNLVSRITGLNDVRDLDVSVQDRTNGESIPDLVLRDGDQPVCAFEHKIVPNAVRTEQIQAHWAKVSTADPALARVVVITPDLDEPIPVRLVKQVGVNSVWLPWSEVYQLAKL